MLDNKNVLKWEELYLPKEKLIEVFKEIYPENSTVVVKLHFGEPGNKTAFHPEDIKPLVEAFKELNIKPILVDTPVAYTSPRHTVEGYEKAVKKRGYPEIAECVITNEGVEVKTKDMTVEVCKTLAEAENVLVLSHVKGHECSGMGGAVKNLGMGGVTRESKELQHTLAEPKFVKDCVGCGTCANLCPVNAIEMKDNKAVVDYSSCAGCSLCEMVCPHDVLEPKGALFDDLLAQAAAAVISKFPENTLYINVIKNVTEHCDCYGNSGEIVAKDLGTLVSKDIVAIDTESVKWLKEASGKDVFKERWHRDPLKQVEFIEEYLGN